MVNKFILNILNNELTFLTNNLIMKTFAQLFLKIMHSLLIVDF